jgi:CBS domain-containing protein
VRLGQFLAPRQTVVPLSGTTVTAAAHELLAALVSVDIVASPERLAQRVDEERSEDIVALGDRAFLLHYRTDAVRDLAVAIGTAPRPIVRERSESGIQQARIVLLIVAPPRMAARYLQLVGAFARVLSREAVVEAVLAQPDAEAVISIPELREQEVPEQLTVRDIMTEQPRAIGPDTPARDAAVDMVRAGVGGLPVVDADRRVIGQLSERELLRHLLSVYLMSGAPGKAQPPSGPSARRTVRDVMTRQVLCVSPEQPLAEVASLMTNKDVDRVPVVREGRLVGVLTRGDIVRKLIGNS